MPHLAKTDKFLWLHWLRLHRDTDHHHVVLLAPRCTCKASCTLLCAAAFHCLPPQESYFSPSFPIDLGFFHQLSCISQECPGLLCWSTALVHQILAVSATDAAFCKKSWSSLWQEGRKKRLFFTFHIPSKGPVHATVKLLFLKMKSPQVVPTLPRS